MEIIQDIMQSEYTFIVICILIIMLLVLNVINNIRFSKLNKKYREFMVRLGNGTNIEEILRKYISKVAEVDNDNKEIMEFCNNINNNMQKCVQKIGIVRYNAYQDVGSDLSFTLAMLDNKNNGVVLNGIYSRDMSNIYAKPIINGESKYTLSEEEKEALKIAKEK